MSRVTKAAPAHTPGPWLSDERIVPWLSGEAPAVRVSHEREPRVWSPVCMVQPDQTGKYQPAGSLNPIADARLIAAAPDLFFVVQELVLRYAGLGHHTVPDEELKQRAIAAHMKATRGEVK